MATVIKEFLIASMHTYPSTEREIGFNTALIMILKKLTDDTSNTQQVLSDLDMLRSIPLKTPYNLSMVDHAEATQILTQIRSKQKLAAVKFLKEITGIGLKEAKDVIDELCVRYSL